MSTPPLIHLDTNHLINIARIRGGGPLDSADKHRQAYKQISDWIEQGTCSLTFYPFLLFEWVDGCPSDRNAQEIAAVLDSAQNLLRIEMSFFTFRLEILDLLRECCPQLQHRSIPIVQPMDSPDNAVNALRDVDPVATQIASLTGDGTFMLPATAVEWIPDARKIVEKHPDQFHQHFATWQTFVAECGECEFQKSAFLLFRASKSVEDILPTLFPGRDPAELLEDVDLRSCRGLSLHSRVLWQYIQLHRKLKENDILDLDQAHIPAFANFVLTERMMKALFRQAGANLQSSVFSSPTDFVNEIQGIIHTGNGSP